MKPNRGPLTVTSLLAALMLISGVSLSHAVAAQTKATPAPQAAPKKPATKAPVRRRPAPRRPRAQAAPTRERIIEIQDALAGQGFYPWKPSGKWDAVTSDAMRKFQTANGLTATGKLGALSLQKLGLGSEVAGRGAPLPQADTRPSVLSESELNEPEPQEP
jgi:peptidoglycan hydrolase-like protein with peptidoglycan-binding domain